ncbi:MAG: IceA2 protein [Fibrobacterales bacterium]|nr:IceA2 protein [Fibrobacterales bacterium]
MIAFISVSVCLFLTFGSNIVAAATDGTLVAAVTASGHVEEWVNGARKRVYSANAVGVQVTGGVVEVQLRNGRTEEWANGARKRIY